MFVVLVVLNDSGACRAHVAAGCESQTQLDWPAAKKVQGGLQFATFAAAAAAADSARCYRLVCAAKFISELTRCPHLVQRRR